MTPPSDGAAAPGAAPDEPSLVDHSMLVLQVLVAVVAAIAAIWLGAIQ